LRRYIIDASVVAKWHFQEDLSERAAALLLLARAGECEIAAPDLVVYEFGSIVLKKLRAGLVTFEDGADILSRLPLAPLGLLPAVEVIPSALELAEATGATFYDAVYLATAAATGATLVTADRELVEQVKPTALADSVLNLAQLEPDI